MHARSFLTGACLAAGLSLLAGCDKSYNCTVDYRGGCVAGPVAPPPAAPAQAPVPVNPPGPPAVELAAPPAASLAAPPAVALGDPATFADVDDRQCRSYGLKFGTHDYADCRIRLSAQHRGLDPSIGAAPARRR